MVTVVRLDGIPNDAVAVGDAVRDRLVRGGIIRANARRDKMWQPSQWEPGPAWESVVESIDWGPAFLTSSNNGVDIAVVRDTYHPVENLSPASCARCGARVADAYYVTLEPWVSGAEPRLTCPSCGWTALVGDWPNEWGFAVGMPAITFNNWPELTKEFLTSMLAQLGGRSRVVRTHM